MKDKKLPNRMIREALIYLLIMTIPLLFLSIRHNGLLYLFSWLSYFQTSEGVQAVNVLPSVLLILVITLYYIFAFKQLISGIMLKNKKETDEDYKEDIDYCNVSVKRTKVGEIVLYGIFSIVLVMQVFFDTINFANTSLIPMIIKLLMLLACIVLTLYFYLKPAIEEYDKVK